MCIYNKVQPNGIVDRCKARFVAKGFSQTYGVDYFEILSPVTWFNSIRVRFSIAVDQNWLMFQLDVKNAFLYVIFEKKNLYGAISRICCLGGECCVQA